MTNSRPPQGTDLDIVAMVESDHRTTRALFDRMAETSAEHRAESWPDLLHSLAVHEVAEELVVFPAIRAISVECGPIVQARLDEQKQAEQVLVELEELDPASDEFAELLERLRDAVLEHAAAEEREVLPLIVRYDDALDRPTLGARYVEAKRRAPTRPHPNAPHRPPANVLVDPVMSFVDRVRDHLR